MGAKAKTSLDDDEARQKISSKSPEKKKKRKKKKKKPSTSNNDCIEDDIDSMRYARNMELCHAKDHVQAFSGPDQRELVIQNKKKKRKTEKTSSKLSEKAVGYDRKDQKNRYMRENDAVDDFLKEDESNDYGLNEEDEEEPRFKYSTVELADGSFRNSTCCLISAGVFFVLVAVGVSLLMSKFINGNDRRLLRGKDQ